jgi:hypothetical protein
MTVTREQAEALAVLTAAARPHRAPQWDVPGIVTAIKNVAHLDLAEVMKACGRAAQMRDLRTPAPIGDLRSTAWRERLVELATPTRPRICPVHGTQYTTAVCSSCRADELGEDRPREYASGQLAAEDASEVVNDLRDRVAKARGDDPPPRTDTTTDHDPAPTSGVAAFQEA